MILKAIVAISAVVLLAWGCGPLLINFYGKKDADKVDWDLVKKHAILSKLTYGTPQEIQKEYGDSAWTMILTQQQSRIIAITDHENKEIWLGIRGTANKHNAIMDAQYIKERDAILDIYVHKGFHDLAKAAYQSFYPHLRSDYSLRITGHSLGGAAAAILAMYYHKEGREIKSCITFGQPKVTNEDGVKTFWDLNLLRIVDHEDVVPLVPPLTIISALHGPYRHLGEEVILENDGHWRWLSKHDANRVLISGTWSNLLNESISDHYMNSYIKRIDDILKRIK
jgi:triacylglycerol lipase